MTNQLLSLMLAVIWFNYLAVDLVWVCKPAIGYHAVHQGLVGMLSLW